MKSSLRLSFAFAALPWIVLPAAPAAPLSWDPTTSAGLTLGGSGNFTNAATNLFWWNGTANVPWTDLTGVDTAILNITPTPDPLPDPSVILNTVTIPNGTTIVGNGLTYAINGYAVVGPGGFNFRNNTAAATVPATITVPTGITGTFSPGNNQNGGTLPPITITGGGTLRWNPAGNGTKITIEGGTLVECFGTNQVLGGGTNNINNGTFRWSASGAADLFYNSANFAGPTPVGTPLGKIDINGRTEVIGTISGNFNITNQGTASAAVVLSGGGGVTYTGVISDHPSDPAITTGLTLTGTNAAAGTNFTSVGNVLTQTIGKPQTYTGNTTLQRGNLTLDFNNAANPGTADLLYNGAVFTPGSGLGGLVFAPNPTSGVEVGTGGRSVLAVNGKLASAVTQRFNGLTLLENTTGGINYTLPTGGSAATTTATITLGDISRATGSSFNISNVGAANGLTVNTTSGTANQILAENGVPWLTIAGSDWAAKDSTNTFLVPATASYTNVTPTSLTDHANVTAGTDVRLLSDTTIKSLRHNLNERRTVDINGYTLTTGSILIGSAVGTSGSSITGGNLTAAGQDLLLVQTAAGNFRYFGIAAPIIDNPGGPVGFTKSGTGSTILTGNNLNTGNLVINQGVLILTGSNTPASVVIQGNTANTNGGQLPTNSATINMLQLGNQDATGSLSTASVTGSGPITIGALAALAIKRSDDVIISNEILGAGNFIQGGTGTVILDGPAANYGWRGDTVVGAGVLNLDYRINDSGKISDLSILRMGGGTVRRSGGTHTEVISSLTLNSGRSRIEADEGATGRLRLNTINGLGSTTAAGTSGSTLDIADSGITDTDTTNTNGIIGAVARVTVAGSDWATNSTNLGDGIVIPYSAYATLATTAGSDTANSQTVTPATTLTGSRTTHTLRLSSAGGAATLDIGTGNTLSLTGGGLLLTGNNPITLNNGILRSGSAVSPELVIHNYAEQPVTLNSAVTYGVSALTGQTHLTLTGPGTTLLTGANSYGGLTYVSGGTAVISSDANLGGANGTIAVTSSLTTSPTVTLTSATLPAGFGPGSRLLGQTVNTISGATVTLGGNATTAITAPGGTASWATANTIVLNRATLKVDGTVNLTQTNAAGALGGAMTINRTISLNGPGGTVEVSGANILTVAGTTNGPGGLTKTGSGVLLYSGSGNVSTGPTTIAAGTLRASASTALSFYSNYTVEAAGTLDLGGSATSTNQTIGSLAGAGTVTNEGSASTVLNIGSIFKSAAFSGLIRNGLSPTAITKIGSGTQTLSGANTYTGNTIVEAGGLIANNATGSATGTGTVTVRSPGSLGGTGSVTGNATINGTLTPGDSNAADTTDDLGFGGNVTLGTNSRYLVEIGGTAAGAYDRIVATGAVNFSAQQDITVKFLPAYTPAAGHVFDLVDAVSLAASDIVFNLPTLPAGLSWETGNFATDGSISIVSGAANLYNTWLNVYFTPAEQLNPAISGPGADADGDGLANAIEYAAGTLPRNAASGGTAALPALTVTPVLGLGYATLTFTANTAALPGITLTGQSGTTLGAWPDALPLFSSTTNGNGTTTLVFRSNTATNVPVRRFYRLNFLPIP